MDLNQRDISECRRIKILCGNLIKFHRYRLEVAVLDSSQLEENKQELKLLIKELEQFQNQLNVNCENFRDYLVLVLGPNYEEQQGLTAQRIQQFEQFQADESFVDDQCVICMGDIETGRNMMRLDCDGQQIFYKVCIEGWFAEHNTCPIRRHSFK